ncbi:hypothetical protein GJ496_002344 [Pomphorhynchus laevis]|nr:hypothetical protein GJ496_002344 [Pomphorhynchus laevis]
MKKNSRHFAAKSFCLYHVCITLEDKLLTKIKVSKKMSITTEEIVVSIAIIIMLMLCLGLFMSYGKYVKTKVVKQEPLNNILSKSPTGEELFENLVKMQKNINERIQRTQSSTLSDKS